MRLWRIGFAVALGVARVGHAEPITHLEGTLRGAVSRDPFAAVGGAVGRFSIDSSGPADLRETPGTLALTTPFGSLTAVAAATPRRNGVRRIDPATARPLRADAPPDATCATGAEAGCWLGPEDPLAQNRAVYDALCLATAGMTGIDSACALTFWNSQYAVAGIPLSQLYGAMLSGSTSGSIMVTNLHPGLAGLPSETRFPALPLLADANDGAGEGALGNASLAHATTVEQGAALGCDAFWGAGCDVGGIDLSNAEAGVVVQSWPGPPNTAIDRDTAEPGQPGTVGFPVEIVAPRGGLAIPGTRGPADLGFDPARDGCVGAGAAGCEGDGFLHPFSDEPFRSELAAFSWNLLLVSVVLSSNGARPEIPCEDGQDPFTCRGADEFIGDPVFAFREDGCSYRRPQLCKEVVALRSYLTTQLDGDPSGAPRTRWLWESGAEYAITGASGDLAAFAGGTAHVLGPEVSRAPDSAIGAPIVLLPPAGVVPDLASPIVERILPGANGVLGDDDDTALGYAYAVAPEPGMLALGVAALGALAASGARKRLTSQRAP